MVLDIWSYNAQFLKLITRDPRSWLLWFKLSSIKNFPDRNLFKLLNLKNQITKYTNLLMAYLYHSELTIFKSLLNLKNIYNLQANNSDFINVFKILGKDDIKKIKSHLCCKDRIITNLTKIYNKIEVDCDNSTLISNLLILFKVPLIYLNRYTLIRFHNMVPVSNQSNGDKKNFWEYIIFNFGPCLIFMMKKYQKNTTLKD